MKVENVVKGNIIKNNILDGVDGYTTDGMETRVDAEGNIILKLKRKFEYKYSIDVYKYIRDIVMPTIHVLEKYTTLRISNKNVLEAWTTELFKNDFHTDTLIPTFRMSVADIYNKHEYIISFDIAEECVYFYKYLIENRELLFSSKTTLDSRCEIRIFTPIKRMEQDGLDIRDNIDVQIGGYYDSYYSIMRLHNTYRHGDDLKAWEEHHSVNYFTPVDRINIEE